MSGGSDMAETSFETNRKRKKRILRISYIFVGVMLFLTFFSSTINNFSLPRVSTERPVGGALIKEFTGGGVIRARETVKVYSGQGRRVNEVKVKPGDKIKKGDVAVVLDKDEIERKLEEEMLRLDQMKLNLEKLTDVESNITSAEKIRTAAKENLDNKRILYGIGAVSGEEVKQAENTLLQAENNLANEKRRQRDNERDIKIQQNSIKLAQLSIDKLQKELNEESALLSPADGFINELNVTEGSLVNGTVPVFSVDDVSKGFEVKIEADGEKAQYLSIGDAVEITVRSKGAAAIDGTIREIAESAQARGAIKDLSIDIPPDGILGGERCDIYINKKTGVYSILVPNAAIGADNKGKFVWILKEKKGPLGSGFFVQKASVTAGDSDSSKTAVISGISTDEQVVVRYSGNLSDGCRVIPVN